MSTTEKAHRTTEEVMDHHNKAFRERDVDAVPEDYAEDAVIIWPEGVVRGRQEIRAFFNDAFTNLLTPGTELAHHKTITEGEIVYSLWQAESATVRMPFGSDTFVIRDGMIVAQTIAWHVIQKGA